MKGKKYLLELLQINICFINSNQIYVCPLTVKISLDFLVQRKTGILCQLQTEINSYKQSFLNIFSQEI